LRKTYSNYKGLVNAANHVSVMEQILYRGT